MPHRIVEIDELVRLVVGELVETSPRTVVSFALTCRSLEEPTLSSLWREKRSLTDLVMVLPNRAWVQDDDGVESIVSVCNFPGDRVRYKFSQAIERDPSAEDWTRLRRYASWMRELFIESNGNITDDILSRLLPNLPDGVLCPKLERLDWVVDISCASLSFPCLFLSPRLKRVNFLAFCTYFGAKRNHLPLVKKVISCLPASLEDISFTCCPWNGGPLKDVISSLVLRCGLPLRSFCSNARLSEEAVYHLMQLPNLRSWTTAGKPPRNLSPATFPSLEELRLEWAALPWLHLLAAREEGKPRNGLAPAAAIMNTNVKETLKFLHCPGNTPVDPTFLSSVSTFRNLVTLYVGNGYCGMGGCAFGLTDDDVENLVVTLPSLVSLQLGKVCGLNSCHTTVSSLLSISVHCLGLSVLEIHFNTDTIAGDIQRLLGEGSGREEPRCALRSLWVGYLPLRVLKGDIGTIAMGFADIFPCLEDFSSYGGDFGSWERVTSILRD